MGIFSSSSHAAPNETQARRAEGTALSIIASGTTIVGDIETAGTVKIEGRIRGSVRAGSQVLITQGGMVEGDVSAPEAIIGGEVHGTIRVEQRVEIQSSSVVHGDIYTQRILVAEGGVVNGNISMGESPEGIPERPLSSRIHANVE